jgi:soluble lytic murein transglycosylase-like protein
MGQIRPYCRPGAGPLRTPVTPPEEIVRVVRDLAPQYGLDPALVLAVIQVESAFRTDAVSPKEAAGLMQLIPETAERFDVRDVFDPQDNIRGGIRYLRWLLAYFRGDVTLALAGYNAGEGAVDRHRGVPPYAETQAYVQLVRRLYPAASHPYDPKAAEPSAHLPKQTAELPR